MSAFGLTLASMAAHDNVQIYQAVKKQKVDSIREYAAWNGVATSGFMFVAHLALLTRAVTNIVIDFHPKTITLVGTNITVTILVLFTAYVLYRKRHLTELLIKGET